jgi:hypothetical protein
MPDEIRCDTCGQVWAAHDLAPIQAWGQVEPGGIVPLGQCPAPDRRALCSPLYGYVHDLEQQCAALLDVVSQLLDWAAMMGGWDTPVWTQARRVLARTRPGARRRPRGRGAARP